MATLTIKYDGRNKTAQTIVQMLRSLDIFSIIEPKSKKKEEDPTLMSKEDFLAMVDQRMEEYEKGNYHTMLPGESLDQFLNRVDSL